MNSLSRFGCGLVGALALNVVHESARQVTPYAPHMDFIAMRALGKALRRIGVAPPPLGTLRKLVLVGDLLSNGLYYSAVTGSSANPPPAAEVWARACALGLSAGVGAVALPPYLGLGQQTSRDFRITGAMTVAWYLLGALTSAAAYLISRTEVPLAEAKSGPVPMLIEDPQLRAA